MNLQIRVRKYFSYIWNEQEQHKQALEQDLLNKLSTQLKTEVVLESNLLALEKLEFLRNNFSKAVLKNAALRLRQLTFTPEEVIYKVLSQLLARPTGQHSLHCPEGNRQFVHWK